LIKEFQNYEFLIFLVNEIKIIFMNSLFLPEILLLIFLRIFKGYAY